jgi:hypothetical protein
MKIHNGANQDPENQIDNGQIDLAVDRQCNYGYALAMFVFKLPFILCDLVVICIDQSCAYRLPDGYTINLRIYLATVLSCWVAISLCDVWKLDITFSDAIQSFLIPWNIYGVALFATEIHHCDTWVYQYLYVSLILKIGFSFVFLLDKFWRLISLGAMI